MKFMEHPKNEDIRKLLRSNPAELGALIGAMLFLSGCALFIYALLKWKAAGFGPLSYPESLRIVIPAITAMALGAQCVFSGFAFALFGLIED